MVDVHAGRDRDIDTRLENRSGTVGRDVCGHIQSTGVGAVVTDALGRRPDAERRHRPVEEPVVVVRREDDDEVGVVVADEPACLGQRGLDVVKESP